MILEAFEIQNWACIQKASVSNLPPTGVVVLHGPNGLGKSSIVRALRAGLMDYASTTAHADLKANYPKGTGEKPIVSIRFRVGDKRYRICKHFGTNKSELASQTSSGDWKLETTSAADAHARTCELVGGNKSVRGLHQLLWLTQAEFQLPDAKAFDAGVQAQLRGILGVLQTPLDDRFIERVKARWNVWHIGQRKAGKQPALKAGSKLTENLKQLADREGELRDSEGKFQEVEGWLRQAGNLEQAIFDWSRQLQQQTDELSRRREEQQQSVTRITARQQAEKDHAAALKEHAAALEEQQVRAAAEKRAVDEENALRPAQEKMEATSRRVEALEQALKRKQSEQSALGEKRRDLQQRAGHVAAKRQALDDAERLADAQAALDGAQAIVDELAGIEAHLREHPTPDKKSLDAWKENRREAARLQAQRDAAAMQLTLAPEAGAAAAQLAVDGGPPRDVPIASSPAVHSVSRRAKLLIPGWGRVEITRGAAETGLDEMEQALHRCHATFASAVAPFGIAGSDPNALDLLISRDAEHRVKSDQLERQKKELKRIAPQGLEPLRTKVVELRTKLKSAAETRAPDAEALPIERADLDRLAATLQQQIASADGEIEALGKVAETRRSDLNQASRDETAARVELAACTAKARGRREELDRLRTDEQIRQRIEDAARALRNAETQLVATALTDDERTINDRVQSAEHAVGALERQINESKSNLDVLTGRLMSVEGLHAERSSLAARVEELKRRTDRESLEREAVDRLYALFEECREKQLGTLMGPIHDRVLGWMSALEIGHYQQMRFNDSLLPETLVSRGGTAEFKMNEESTGTQEQIGMLVRLALGSLLATASEPAVAILDDPLTHSDSGRLNKMRVILRRAAEGAPHLAPPAGPLQIVIFTCHPEWFRDERATVIDLGNPEVMTRVPV